MILFGKTLVSNRENVMEVEKMGIVVDAAMQAAEASEVIRRNLGYNDGILSTGGTEFTLKQNARLILISLGKAAGAMTAAAVEILGRRITCGLCISKHRPLHLKDSLNINLVIGNHPIPGAGSLQAGQEIQNLLSKMSPDDLVLLLLSGGGSSLATLPVEGITLDDLQQTTRVLLRAGATINEINTVRKHLDRVKGGGMLKMADPARVVTLILSDVVGNPLDVIASGPTVPDPTTYDQALEIIEQSANYGEIPIPVLEHLRSGSKGMIPETLKPDAAKYRSVINLVVGSNEVSCEAAANTARNAGFHAKVLTTSLTGEARNVGAKLAELGRIYQSAARPFVLILGGETTVTVKGNGVGGRNLEVALGAVEGFAGLQNTCLVTCATDGEDGTSGAAGAFVDGSSLERAISLGLNPLGFLENNDSFTFFNKLGDALLTGPSGTNVNDINFIFGI